MDGDRSNVTVSDLPKPLVESILCLTCTTPVDACMMACISSTFRSAADSDTFWHRFLLADYKSLVDTAMGSSHVSHSSLKELYFLLCVGNFLMNDGSLSFWLDRRSGKKCYMISSKALSIKTDQDEARKWISIPQSRFPVVLEVPNVTSIDVDGVMHKQLLSCDTVYAFYLVFKKELTSNAVTDNKTEDDVMLVSREYPTSEVYYVQPPTPRRRRRMLRGYFPDDDPREKTLKTRKDGWAELDLGIGCIEKEPHERWEKVAAWMTDMSDDILISRLIIQGIEVRPKHGVTPATVLMDCFRIVDE